MTQAQFGNGVIRSFLVSCCINDRGECIGNFGAVLGNVTHLSIGKPKLDEQVKYQQTGENQGES